MGREPGSLFIGHPLDGADSGAELTVPRHHLTTHGVIVGMTGSGKTGLGIVLLEEVLASGIPVLILDPKGDMGNLLLNFPELKATDFLPWIDGAEARREGMSEEEMASKTAERWASGLSRSGLGSDDLRRLRDSVDMRLLTPGSEAGIPLNILGDLSAPDASWDEHSETIREEVEGLVSGLLVLAGIQADPLTSREHILLSNLVEHAWRAGTDLDLATLLTQIQTPPMRRLGIFELDTFFPAADRAKLAMRLNGLVASPSFAAWLEGAPLSVNDLLFAPDGRPRASIVYLSHLSETERQFVITLLLSKLVTWMRQQPGTSDLRALVYVDEMFGMAPPTAEPPTKRPLLTLFKQARAHGLGLVVSTQNPVDLDYKLMSNAGTWMVGRLQTERDKARIIEALRSASGDVDVSAWSERIGELGKREFLLKSTRSAEPVAFTTRWAMSFLRGPLTRSELLALRPAREEAARAPATEQASAAGAPATTEALGHDEVAAPPRIAKGVPVRFLDPAAPWAAKLGVAAGSRSHELGAAVTFELLFDDTKSDLRHLEPWEAVLFPLSESPDPEDAIVVDHDPRDFREEAPDGAVFRLPEAPIGRKEFFRSLESGLKDHLYRHRTVEILRNGELKLHSRVGEDADAFRQRCLEVAEDRADDEAAKLRDRYEKRLDTARRRQEQAERRVRELEVDVSQRRQQELVSGAGEVLSLFLGGRRRIRSLSGAASRRSQTRRTGERLRSAEEKLQASADDILELEQDLEGELAEIWKKWEEIAQDVEVMEVGLEKSDIALKDLRVFWAPRP